MSVKRLDEAVEIPEVAALRLVLVRSRLFGCFLVSLTHRCVLVVDHDDNMVAPDGVERVTVSSDVYGGARDLDKLFDHLSIEE
jgi:hypothetical protein